MTYSACGKVETILGDDGAGKREDESSDGLHIGNVWWRVLV